MAQQIEHAYVEALSNFTTTSTTYVDVTDAVIPSGSFTAGKKYWLMITGLPASSSVNDIFAIRVVHGSTAFPSSEFIREPAIGSSSNRHTYGWFAVWEAVSGEDVKVQIHRAAGTNAGTQMLTMLAVCLSDDLTENTDWKYSEVIADTVLSSSFSSSNNAAVTITPALAGRNWLVLAQSQIVAGNATNQLQTRITRSGEASSNVPLRQYEAESAASELLMMCQGRAFNLGASSNTFTEESAINGGTGTTTRKASAVFLLNLSKFKDSGVFWDESEVDLSGTDYGTEIANLDITPSQSGNMYILSMWSFDMVAAGIPCDSRIQVGGVDKPGTNTQNREAGADAADESPICDAALIAVTADVLQDIDVDASTTTAGAGRSAQHRALVAFTMELVSRLVSPSDSILLRDPNCIEVAAF